MYNAVINHANIQDTVASVEAKGFVITSCSIEDIKTGTYHQQHDAAVSI